MRINKGDFSNRRPKLEQEHLTDDVAILTIAEADVLTVEERQAIVLSFEETGDHVLWPNGTEVNILIDFIGDDTDEWIGKRVAVEKVTRTYKGQAFDKVAIAEDQAAYVKPKKSAASVGKKR